MSPRSKKSERETGNPPGSWFSASEVHLDGSGETDLVVMGRGPLRGANVTTFWVFRGTLQGHVLVLTIPAHDLEITNTRWNGYRKIRTDAMTAVRSYTNLYRFDGGQYQAYKKKSTALK